MSTFPPQMFAVKRFAVLGMGRNGLPAVQALSACGAHVQAWDDGATPCQRHNCWQAVAAKPEHGKTLPGEQGGRETVHRSFSVARPHRPRIMEMIQNRMTMVGSVHPFFSK